MAKRGKKYKAVVSKLDKTKAYSLSEAIEFLKRNSYANFDETLECAVKIEYKAPQNVRGVVHFPHSTGKPVRVLVFAEGEKQKEAVESGADYVGGKELVDEIKNEGFLDFDVAVATPQMMREVGKLGPILGRRGLMPSPKTGTVTEKIADVVKELKAGRLSFRADRTGVVHAGVGKLSQDTKVLEENAKAFFESVKRAKPTDAKGEFVKSFYVSSTMGPGIRINHKELR